MDMEMEWKMWMDEGSLGFTKGKGMSQAPKWSKEKEEEEKEEERTAQVFFPLSFFLNFSEAR